MHRQSWGFRCQRICEGHYHTEARITCTLDSSRWTRWIWLTHMIIQDLHVLPSMLPPLRTSHFRRLGVHETHPRLGTNGARWQKRESQSTTHTWFWNLRESSVLCSDQSKSCDMEYTIHRRYCEMDAHSKAARNQLCQVVG
jgi:hypothetical protein